LKIYDESHLKGRKKHLKEKQTNKQNNTCINQDQKKLCIAHKNIYSALMQTYYTGSEIGNIVNAFEMGIQIRLKGDNQT
jgi:hypothetical protein